MRKTGSLRRFRMTFLMAILALTIIGGSCSVQAAPKLSKKKLTMCVGNKYTLKVKKGSGKVKWSSSDKSVASVKKGKVTAKKAGRATITAKVGKKKLTCKVTVLPTYKINRQQVSVFNLNLVKGQSKKVTITFPLDVTISFKSSKPSVVDGKWQKGWKGDDTGFTVIAKDYGDAVITIYNKYNKDKLKIKVHVAYPYDNTQVVIPDTIGGDNAPSNRFKVLKTEFFDYSSYSDNFSMRVTMKMVKYGKPGRTNWGSYVDCYDGSGRYLGECYLYADGLALNRTFSYNVSRIPAKTKKIVFRENPEPVSASSGSSGSTPETKTEEEKPKTNPGGWTLEKGTECKSHLDSASEQSQKASKVDSNYSYLTKNQKLQMMLSYAKIANGYLELAYEIAAAYEETYSDGKTLDEKIREVMDVYDELAATEITADNADSLYSNFNYRISNYNLMISRLRVSCATLNVQLAKDITAALVGI